MKETTTVYFGGKTYSIDSTGMSFDLCQKCHGLLCIHTKERLDKDGMARLQHARETLPACPGHPDSVAGLEVRYAEADAFLATMGEIILRVLTEHPDEVYKRYRQFEALYRDMQRVIREQVKDEVRA